MIRLRGLKILGFGAFNGEPVSIAFCPERITLLIGDNETGKSTLATALFASLYGLEYDRRRLKTTHLPHVEVWRPRTEPFGVHLRLATDGRELQAEWDFAAGTLCVRDLATHEDVTAHYRNGSREYNLGRTLLGLSAEEFQKLAYVAQGRAGDETCLEKLGDFVQRLAGSTSGDRTAAEAVAALEEALSAYPGRTGSRPTIQIDTEITRLERELHDRRTQIQKIEEARQRLAPCEAEYQSLTRQEKALAVAIHCGYFQELLARRREAQVALDESRAAHAALAQHQRALAELEYLATFPAAQAPQLRELLAKRKRALEEREKVRRVIAEKLRPAYTSAQQALERHGELSCAGEKDEDTARGILEQARVAEQDAARIGADLAKAERSLAAAGISLAQVEDLRTRLAPLSESERGMLREQERTTLQLQLQATEGRAAVNSARERLQQIQYLRARRTQIANLIVMSSLLATIAAGVLTVLAGAGRIALPPLLFGVLTLLGVGGVACGCLLRASAKRLGADDYQAAVTTLQKGDAAVRAAEQCLRTFDDAVRQFAQRCNCNSVAALREAAHTLEELEHRCQPLLSLRRDHGQVQARLSQLEQELALLQGKFGIRPQPGGLASNAERLLEAIRAARRAQALLVDAERNLNTAEATVCQLDEEAAQYELQARDIMRKAGIGDESAIEAAAKEYENRLRLAELRDRLRQEVIPQAEERCRKAGQPEDLAREITDLDVKIASLMAEHAELHRLEAPQSANFYREQVRQLEQERQKLAARCSEAAEAVRDIQRRWREELPLLEGEAEALGTLLARAKRHRDALILALSEMRAVAQEVHARWSHALNRQVNEILPAIVPTLCDLRFDDNLRFRLLRQDNQEVIEQEAAPLRLSVGQRDQLYLAIRLGLAAFAGGTHPLPLILDDPFVNFDDERFRAAVCFLGERVQTRKTNGQQIILLSCHRRRFQWLRAEDPEWFDARFAWQEMPPLCQKGKPSGATNRSGV